MDNHETTRFVMLFEPKMMYNDLQLKEGLHTYENINVEDYTGFKIVPYTPENILNMTDYGNVMADVILPSDVNISSACGPCSARYVDKVILKNVRLVKDEPFWKDYNLCMKLAEKNAHVLNFVPVQTPELCEVALKHYPYAIQFIEHQTYEQCLNAVSKEGCLLRYINEQTPNICLTAVTNDGNALRYVINKTDEICLAAVKQSAIAWMFARYKFRNKYEATLSL